MAVQVGLHAVGHQLLHQCHRIGFEHLILGGHHDRRREGLAVDVHHRTSTGQGDRAFVELRGELGELVHRQVCIRSAGAIRIARHVEVQERRVGDVRHRARQPVAVGELDHLGGEEPACRIPRHDHAVETTLEHQFAIGLIGVGDRGAHPCLRELPVGHRVERQVDVEAQAGRNRAVRGQPTHHESSAMQVQHRGRVVTFAGSGRHHQFDRPTGEGHLLADDAARARGQCEQFIDHEQRPEPEHADRPQGEGRFDEQPRAQPDRVRAQTRVSVCGDGHDEPPCVQSCGAAVSATTAATPGG